jgi:murein DD-endopeptidase MepM/ murein hydrolase activator NlpD
MRALLVGFLLLITAPGTPWVWPLESPRIVRGFDPPSTPWGPGHRGVDIAGGGQVRAIGPGVVTFVGEVGGKPVVVISHGALRSTYEPVRGTAGVGLPVQAGDAIGVLQPGHCAMPCLHLGLRRGDHYLDPRVVLQRAVLKSPARG